MSKISKSGQGQELYAQCCTLFSVAYCKVLYIVHCKDTMNGIIDFQVYYSILFGVMHGTYTVRLGLLHGITPFLLLSNARNCTQYCVV